jgi:hypothetical protein
MHLHPVMQICLGFPLFLKFQNYVCEFSLLYHCWEFNNSNIEHEKQQQNLDPKKIPVGTTHRYKVGANEYHWLRVVQLACGFFFVVDYIVNLYSAPVRLYYIFSFKGLVDFVSTLPIILYWR